MKRRHWLWVALALGTLAIWFLTDAPQRWTEWRRGKAAASTLPIASPTVAGVLPLRGIQAG
jgi:hypothetical protein